MISAQAQGPAGPPPKAPTDVKPGSITYDDIPYPYPVQFLPLTFYGQDVHMAYMDVPPAGHVPHLEMPDILQRELLKFLKSDASATSTRSGSDPSPIRISLTHI